MENSFNLIEYVENPGLFEHFWLKSNYFQLNSNYFQYKLTFSIIFLPEFVLSRWFRLNPATISDRKSQLKDDSDLIKKKIGLWSIKSHIKLFRSREKNEKSFIPSTPEVGSWEDRLVFCSTCTITSGLPFSTNST